VAAQRIRTARPLAAYDGRGFCARGGSRVACIDDDVVEIRLRSLDDAPYGLQPEAEIWIKRREPWLRPVAQRSIMRTAPETLGA